MHVQSLQSCLTLGDPMTVGRQAPLSMDFPGKGTGVGCHALLQEIFLTQGSNPVLLHCRQILKLLSHQGRRSKATFIPLPDPFLALSSSDPSSRTISQAEFL